MEEGCNSWVRRVKFSQTICHRLDCSRIPGLPFAGPLPRSVSAQTSRIREPDKPPKKCGQNGKKECVSLGAEGGSVSPTPLIYIGDGRMAGSKLRASSPVPAMNVSDTFKEARLEAKRFSTPMPRRRERGAELRGRLFHRDAKSGISNSCLKVHEKGKGRKENVWSRYFDSAGGRVNAVQMIEEPMVDLSQLYFGNKFATGAHSRLYHGIYKDEAVAVKVITQPDDDENGLMAAQLAKQFSREVAILSRLCHRNILKLIGSCSTPPVFVIITEYLSGGCLRAFLHKLEKKTLPLQQIIAISLDIARGMEYIHSQGVFHCDLKPENILFDKDFCAKIADFGIACEEARYDALGGDPGTYRWMAPEMIKRKKYGRKVDVYSFGLILWVMLTGKIPYEDMTPVQAAFAVINKGLRPSIPVDCPLPLRALIEQCWVLHPEKRPEFWQIVKVLEQFESALARDGTLKQIQSLTCQEEKKRLLHWIQKLKPVHRTGSSQQIPRLF